MVLLLTASLLIVAAVAVVVVGCAFARATDLMRRVQGRLMIVIGAFVGIAVGSWWLLSEVPASSGILLLASPGLAAAIGVCLFGFVPFRDPGRSGVRTASLAVRTSGTVLTVRMITVPSAALVLLVVLLSATGGSADANGVTLSVSEGLSIGPYPGWFYGGPMLVIAGVLVAVTAAAVRRSVLLPAMDRPATNRPVGDDRWRRFIGSTLSGVVTSGLLLYLAETTWLTGRVLNSASHLAAHADEGLALTGAVLLAISPLLLVCVVALLTRACISIRRLTDPVTSTAVRA